MEQAIFISHLKDIDLISGRYSRLYFGVEFCERLAPSRSEIDRLLLFVAEKKIAVTLVTPFLTNRGVATYQGIIEHLLVRHPGAEIVVNDWGLLYWLNKHYSNLNLALGRLLTKQKRGPRIMRLKGRVPPSMVDHFQRCNVDSAILTEFLASHMVKRVELDNLLQGIRRMPHALPGSLYTPFAYVTTTRLCFFNASKDRHRPLRMIAPCNRECLANSFSLRHADMPVDLLLKGNTQFIRNELLPDNLADLNIDRIVYEPNLPL